MNCRLFKKPFDKSQQYNFSITPNIRITTQRPISSIVKSTQCSYTKHGSFSFFHPSTQINQNSFNIHFNSNKRLQQSTDDRGNGKGDDKKRKLKHKDIKCTKSKSVSSYFNKKYTSLSNQVIVTEKLLSSKRQRIKGKLRSLMNKSYVLNQEMYAKLNKLFHKEDYYNNNEIDDEDDKDYDNDKSSLRKNFSFKFTPELFSKERTYFRYEDYHENPEAFLSKHFTKKEMDLMISEPYHFGLKSIPFKGANIRIIDNLKDKLNREEDNLIKKMKQKKNNKTPSLLYNLKLRSESDKEVSIIKSSNDAKANFSANNDMKKKSSSLIKRYKSTTSEILQRATPKKETIKKGLFSFEKLSLIDKSPTYFIEKSNNKIKQMEIRKKESIKLNNQLKQDKKREFMKLIISHLEMKSKSKEEYDIVHNTQSQIIKNYFNSPFNQKRDNRTKTNKL